MSFTSTLDQLYLKLKANPVTYRFGLDPVERAGKTFLQVLLVVLVPLFATGHVTYGHAFEAAGLGAAASFLSQELLALGKVQLNGGWDLILRAAKTFGSTYLGIVFLNGVVDLSATHWAHAFTPAITATITSLFTSLATLYSGSTLGASAVTSPAVAKLGLRLRYGVGVPRPPRPSTSQLQQALDRPLPPPMPETGNPTPATPEQPREEWHPESAPEQLEELPPVEHEALVNEEVMVDLPPAATEAPEEEVLTPRQLAARKGAETRRRNAAAAAAKKASRKKK